MLEQGYSVRAVIRGWIVGALGLDTAARRRRENDRMVMEIEEQQEADDLATIEPAETIIVCDKCLRACCWQGEFMCGSAYGGAGTVEKTVEELRDLKAGEHESYWDINPDTGVAYRCRGTP